MRHHLIRVCTSDLRVFPQPSNHKFRENLIHNKFFFGHKNMPLKLIYLFSFVQRGGDDFMNNILYHVQLLSVYRSISGQSLSDTEMASATAHFAVENSFGQPHWLIAMLFTMHYSLFTAWCSARMKSSSNYDQFSSDTTSGRPSVPLLLSTGELNYTYVRYWL